MPPRFILLKMVFLLLGLPLPVLMGGEDGELTRQETKKVETKLASTTPKDQKRTAENAYIRLRRDKSGVVIAMDTAVVQCVPRDCGRTGPTVDLFSAIHVADRGYYEQLNREFAKYDAVLYELVAKENTRPSPEKAGRATHPVALLQMGLKGLLDLDYQLDRVDYTKSNMIHADMSPEQLAESMSQRGESVWTMLLRALGYSLAKQEGRAAEQQDLKILFALLDPQRSLALKRLFAEELQDLDGLTLALGGGKGSALVEERNKVALAGLRKQLAAGKQKIAIFYGGAHLPDMERRLADDFNLAPISTRWLVAWNLAAPSQSPPKLKDLVK